MTYLSGRNLRWSPPGENIPAKILLVGHQDRYGGFQVGRPSQVLESYPPFLSKVRFLDLKLFQIVMQLQSLVDLSHDLRWELAQFFA